MHVFVVCVSSDFNMRIGLVEKSKASSQIAKKMSTYDSNEKSNKHPRMQSTQPIGLTKLDPH